MFIIFTLGPLHTLYYNCNAEKKTHKKYSLFVILCSKRNSLLGKLSPAPAPLGILLATAPRCCVSIFVWQLKSFSFAIFCAGSQWTAGLEKPQHRQSGSPSLSSHSWNPLLNNEPNLSSASRGGELGGGGGPQSHPQLSARLCCPYMRAGAHKQNPHQFPLAVSLCYHK